MGYSKVVFIILIAPYFWAMQLTAQVVDAHGFQERNIPAVAALKNYAKPDTARVNALIKVLNTAAFLKEKKALSPYLQEAFEISRKINYVSGLANCYLHKASFYKSSSEYVKALLYYDSALFVADYIRDGNSLLIKAKALEQKGNIYFNEENYYTSLDFYLEALKYVAADDTPRQIRIHIFITEIYTFLNNLEKAAEHAEKNIALIEKNTGRAAINASVYLSVIEIYLRKKDTKMATSYLDKMGAQMPDTKEVLTTFGYFLKRGRVSELEGQLDQAHDYFKEAFNYAVAGGHAGSKTTALYFLSGTALQLGDYEAARQYATLNLELAEKMETKSPKVEALLALSNYYDKTGNKDKALQLTQQAMNLKDTLIAETNLHQLKVSGAVYESEKQQKKIAQLQLVSEKQVTSEKRKSMLNNVLIVCIIAFFILSYLGYSNVKKGRQLYKQEQALQNQKIIELEKTRQLVTIDAMLKGQEEERSRIAKDLHDGLGSLLSGTKLSLMNVKEKISLSNENKTLFEKSLSLLDNTIGDLRKVAQNLMPEALVKFGLHEALRDFCDFIQSSSDVKVVYLQFGTKRKLSNTAEVSIYRMIQELVNNALKYAEAAQIIVQLSMQPDKIIVAVEDDGKGFDKSSLAHHKGAGINNIRYRVQYFNGVMDIITSPGNGTSVNIELMT